MKDRDWRARFNDRVQRYPEGRLLDPGQPVLVRVDPGYAATYAGQATLLTAANLLGRMTPQLAIDVPGIAVHGSLPWAGRELGDVILAGLKAADPWGHFDLRAARADDFVVGIGTSEADLAAAGSGWNAAVGSMTAQLPANTDANPFGPALAAVLIGAAFGVNGFQQGRTQVAMNALTWRSELVSPDACVLVEAPALGNLWTVGVGSVGTATLYFLSLLTQQYEASLIDMDDVKVENLSRSPIFIDEDVGKPKVLAAERFLRDAGIRSVTPEVAALDCSALWKARQNGTPDLLIAAANERNVREIIEEGFPPVQVYGTTGKNWQAAMIRHVPLVEACSCCVFPSQSFVPAACGTGQVQAKGTSEVVDAALPFLSFAAGLMAAAEIVKLGLPGFPFTSNRVALSFRPSPRAVSFQTPRRDGCNCSERSKSVQRAMIAGSRYAGS